MATISKFYLLDAATPNTGTMPFNALLIDITSTATTGDATGARTARDATDVAGTSNPDLESTLTSNANTTGQMWGHRRFVSRPLAAQTLPSGTNWTFSAACSESSLNHNQVLCVTIYPWRPTTGLALGPYNAFCALTEPTVAATETALSAVGASGTSLAILDGDILVFDVATTFTQSMATAYTEQFAYNGTTEASTTTCASFITPPAALTLYAAPVILPIVNFAANIQ